MLLTRLVQTSAAVTATRSRIAKRHLLAEALAESGDATEADIVASYLSGRLRQRRTGVGWRSLLSLPEPAAAPSLTPAEVDAAMAALSGLSGPGSGGARDRDVAALFGRATAAEQDYLRRLVIGELRQGALDALLLEAIAEAASLPVATVRRAAMFSAFSGPVAAAALGGGEAALAAFRLEPLRPVRPMLASPAPDVSTALDGFAGAPVAVDAKLDGIRIQAHRAGDEIAIFTRSLDDITERVPEIVRFVRGLPVDAVVLDGEALLLGPDGRPRPFQETGSRTMTRQHAEPGEQAGPGDQADPDEQAGPGPTAPLSAFFFDVLHLDGRDLIDAPAGERFAALAAAVPAEAIVPRTVVAEPAAVQEYFATVLQRGYEGVVIKDLSAPYAAGRRGAAWVKVKPRHTLDLVVLAVERGSGRRSGLLSNIHLGARDGSKFVMLGKTFKGMTDEMLAWQTARFTELKVDDNGWVVTVRPEQVVEVAFDGVQRSVRYPGGVTLRFARVLRYRTDKTAAEADTLDTVRKLAEG
ncbi:ATP-dependent DNA ligase [Raineyella sp. LH-20]|uniref:ATP-dependent DNA ligase n=1 Tax=Raineyella sp. LH-20 TaxID=3081204 RepID=UPI002953E2C7|nr:ATP-dependent DNA ligase [Raineyella sp. LH-20]WOP18395.1 ATP-dependent DNA ligase [Raineyella sp. LH-20]